MFSISYLKIFNFTTIQIKLMIVSGTINNLCFLFTFINKLKYFNVTRLSLFTPISLTNKDLGLVLPVKQFGPNHIKSGRTGDILENKFCHNFFRRKGTGWAGAEGPKSWAQTYLIYPLTHGICLEYPLNNFCL